ncbi:MAG: hypothetical protein ABIH83_01080 [Candidatus Micrarchaeota archaeon]
MTIMFLLPAAFAAPKWEVAVSAAIAISILGAAIAYLAVHAMRLEVMKPVVYDEIGQVVLNVIIIGVIILSLSYFDDSIKKFVFGFSQPSDTCKECSKDTEQYIYCKASAKNPDSCNFDPNAPVEPPAENLRGWALNLNDRSQKLLEKRIDNMVEYSNAIGEQSSRSGMCNFLAIGFTIAGCSSWGVLRGPVGQMINVAGMGMMDLEAERILLQFAQNTVLALFLPLGILMRALYITRKAGSTLIALALSFYLIFPAVILMGNAVADAFIKNYQDYGDISGLDAGSIECDPFDPDLRDLKNQIKQVNEGGKNDEPSKSETLIFYVLGRNVMITALALTATLGAAGALGKGLGAEIYISAIARLS